MRFGRGWSNGCRRRLRGRQPKWERCPLHSNGNPSSRSSSRDLRRLPPIEDRLDDLRREQRQPQNPADVGRVDALRPGQVLQRRVHARRPASSATGTPAPAPSPSRCRPAAVAPTRPHPASQPDSARRALERRKARWKRANNYCRESTRATCRRTRPVRWRQESLHADASRLQARLSRPELADAAGPDRVSRQRCPQRPEPSARARSIARAATCSAIPRPAFTSLG